MKLKHEAFYKSGEYEVCLQKMLDEMALHNNVKNEVKSEVKVEVKA